MIALIFGLGVFCLVASAILLYRLTRLSPISHPNATILVGFINDGVRHVVSHQFKSIRIFLGICVIAVIAVKFFLHDFHTSLMFPAILLSLGSAYIISRWMTYISISSLTRLLAGFEKSTQEGENRVLISALSVGFGLVGMALILVCVGTGVVGLMFHIHSIEMLKVLSFMVPHWQWVLVHAHPNYLHRFLSLESILTLMALCMGATLFAAYTRIHSALFSKSADIAADTVGRTEYDLYEDDLRNPISIADLVGDQVGHIVGMGVLLFEGLLFLSFSNVALKLSLEDMILHFDLQTLYTLLMEPVLFLGLGALLCALVVPLIRILAPPSFQNPFFGMLAVYFSLALVAWGGDLLGLFSPDFLHMAVCGSALGSVIILNTLWFLSPRFGWMSRMVKSYSVGTLPSFFEGLSQAILASILPIISIIGILYFGFFTSSDLPDSLPAIFYWISGVLLAMLSPVPLIMGLATGSALLDTVRGIGSMLNLDPQMMQGIYDRDAQGSALAILNRLIITIPGILSSGIIMVFFIKRLGHMITMLTPHVYWHHLDHLLMRQLSFSLETPTVWIGVLFGVLGVGLFSGLLIMAVQKGVTALTLDAREQMSNTPGIWEGQGLPDYFKLVTHLHQIAHTWTWRTIALASGCSLLSLLTLGVTGSVAFILGLASTGLVASIFCTLAGSIWRNGKKQLERGRPEVLQSSAYLSSLFTDGIGDMLKDVIAPTLYILIKIMAILMVLMGSLALN